MMNYGIAILAALVDNPADDHTRLVYADWLEERGLQEEANILRAEAAPSAAAKVAHALLTRQRRAELLKEADEAYSQRQVSRGYWLREEARMLGSVGHVDVFFPSNMRGKPEPGEIWVRPSTGGRWGKSRKHKVGRPLTAREMVDLLQEAIAA